MLKIKDNIKLNKLQEFGFDEEEDRYFYYEFTNPDCNSELRLYIDKKTREISTGIDMYANPYAIHNKIYDLITAGLVEKC